MVPARWIAAVVAVSALASSIASADVPLKLNPPDNQQARKILDEARVTVSFKDTPALQAIDLLSTLAKINLVVDKPKVEEGKTVTLKMANAPLSATLGFVADQMGMKWTVRDGAVLFSDDEGVAEPTVRVVYGVADLANSRTHGHDKTPDEVLNDLVENIKQVIAPGTWGDEERTAARPFDGTIVVLQTPKVQRKVAEYLADLRRALGPAAPAVAGAGKDVPELPALPADRPENRDVRQALDMTVVSVAFADTPAYDALQRLAEMAKVNIVPDGPSFPKDWKAVTLKLDGVPVSTALKFLTRQIDMRWTVRDGLVVVGDRSSIETPRLRVVYPVSDFLKSRRAAQPDISDEEALNDLIDLTKQLVEPGNWDEGSGNAIRGFQGVMIVLHSPDVQLEVRDFLADLRKARPRQAK